MGTWSAACWAPGTALASLSRPAPRRGPERELEAGNRALAEQTRSCTRYVYCGEALWEGLEAEGWVCWQESLGRRSSGRGAERRLLLLRRSAPAGPGCPEQRLCYPG